VCFDDGLEVWGFEGGGAVVGYGVELIEGVLVVLGFCEVVWVFADVLADVGCDLALSVHSLDIDDRRSGQLAYAV